MTKANISPSHAVQGMVMICIAFALFSTIDADAKWLSTLGYLPFQIAFMRYAGQLVVHLSLSPRDLQNFIRLPRRTLFWVTLRATSLALATLFNFIALKYLPLTTTAVIMFSTPLWVCALSGPILGERVGVWRWSAVALGMFGVLIAMQPSGEFHFAIFASMAAAVSFASYSLLSRYLAGSADTAALQMSTAFVGTVIFIPLMLFQWRWPENIYHWLLFAILGVIAWVGHGLYTRAHQLAEASALSPFGYLLFVFMGIWGWLLFRQLPDAKTLIGAALAVTAGVVIWWRESRY